MIAERITKLVAECDSIPTPSNVDEQLWRDYQHALKQHLISAAGVATLLDVGERTGRFDRTTTSELVGAGGSSGFGGRSG